GPLLIVVLSPDLTGSAYFSGTSIKLTLPLALPWDWAMILPIAWPLPAAVFTAMWTSPNGTLSRWYFPLSSMKPWAEPLSFCATTSAADTGSVPYLTLPSRVAPDSAYLTPLLPHAAIARQRPTSESRAIDSAVRFIASPNSTGLRCQGSVVF